MFSSTVKVMRTLQRGKLKTKTKLTNMWWQKGQRFANIEFYKVFKQES